MDNFREKPKVHQYPRISSSDLEWSDLVPTPSFGNLSVSKMFQDEIEQAPVVEYLLSTDVKIFLTQLQEIVFS